VYLLLADDDVQERTALRRLFEQDPETVIVGEIVDVDGLLEQAQAVRPDLLLLDWELPGMQPAGLVQALHCLGYPLKVIAFGTRPEACAEALAAGVDAFVSKEEPVEELLKTVRSVGELSPYIVG
jgi:two-component system response regulator DesR